MGADAQASQSKVEHSQPWLGRAEHAQHVGSHWEELEGCERDQMSLMDGKDPELFPEPL